MTSQNIFVNFYSLMQNNYTTTLYFCKAKFIKKKEAAFEGEG